MTSLFASTQYREDLSSYVRMGAVEERDLRAVASLFSLSGDDPDCDRLAWVALALVLATPRSGHTCIDLSNMGLWAPTDAAVTPEEWPTEPAPWINAVTALRALVCSPDERNQLPRRPFILDGNRLYAARSFDEEVRVAGYLRGALADKSIQILVGGPGSGKTTAVANWLVSHMMSATEPQSIALAAPTGLAAKRMARAIRAAVRVLKPTDEIEKAIEALPKLTVHKLLRFNPSAKVQWRHNSSNRLPHDIVIIDEVSMMPLSMMGRLLDAMKPGARLMLVGDPNQLASVDAGTVLADIVEASDKGPGFVNLMPGTYRFPAGSPVGDIAAHTKAGDVDGVMAAVARHAQGPSTGPRFSWVDPAADEAGLNDVAALVVAHARHLCELASEATSDAQYRKVIEFRDSLQVVCAHRRGNLGVSGWNRAVERRLGPLARGQWYVGRPVMVTKNDPFSGLSNGDIGVVCRNATGASVVVFGDAEEVVVLPVSKVPNVETVHALTIHKSQGSEYEHTIVVLPKRASRILTRELLYTGMTRAKPHLTIVATQDALKSCVATRIQRATGLADRL